MRSYGITLRFELIIVNACHVVLSQPRGSWGYKIHLTKKPKYRQVITNQVYLEMCILDNPNIIFSQNVLLKTYFPVNLPLQAS